MFLYDSVVRYKNDERFFNMYHSICKYNTGIPHQPQRLMERDNKEWNRTHQNHIKEIDFFLDVDGELDTIKYTKEDVIVISEFFDSLNVPYEVRFSGRGFHFVIPFKFFQHLDLSFDYTQENSYIALYLKIAEYIFNNFTDQVDLSIYDSRRIIKVAYSLAVYPNNENNYVTWCFHTKQGLNSFKLEEHILTPENFDNITKSIKMRGTYLFNKDGNINKLIEVINEKDNTRGV